MMPAPAPLLRGLAIAALVVAWAILAHLGSAGGGDPDFAVAMALAPIAAILAAIIWRRSPRLATAAVTGFTIGVILSWPALRSNVALLYFVQHAGTNLALAALFGRTLLPGREALVTHFALLAHGGTISAAKTRYTRQVTLAWSLFFCINAAISTFLFVFAPATAWSAWANLGTLPLVGVMFVGEHLVRMRVLLPEDRSSIADTIRGYRSAMEERSHGTAGRP